MNNDRNYIYAFPTPYGTCNVINYSGKSDVNSFLYLFDVWGSRGHQMLCKDENHSKFLFECSEGFYNLLKTDMFQQVFKRMGVKIAFDEDYETCIKDID